MMEEIRKVLSLFGDCGKYIRSECSICSRKLSELMITGDFKYLNF